MKQTPDRLLRRVSSRELVANDEDFDIDLNALECAEQSDEKEPLFGEFYF